MYISVLIIISYLCVCSVSVVLGQSSLAPAPEGGDTLPDGEGIDLGAIGGGGGGFPMPNQPNPTYECLGCDYFEYEIKIPEIAETLNYFEPRDWCLDADIRNVSNIPDGYKRYCSACGKAITDLRLVLFDGRIINVKWITRQCMDFFLSVVPPGTCTRKDKMPLLMVEDLKYHLQVFQRVGFAASEMMDVEFCSCASTLCNNGDIDTAGTISMDFYETPSNGGQLNEFGCFTQSFISICGVFYLMTMWG